MLGQDYQVRMKLKVLFLILTLNMSLITSAESFGIVVHGGAGVLSGLSIERQQEIENKVKDTLILAYKILEDGGSSIDAVEFAVSEFEDSNLFNAGKGSVYNSNEVQEMDASIMNGANRSAGAVASVQIIKNPIKLARKVLEETDHVLLVGQGAEIFAKDIEETIVDRSYFHSEKNLERLKKAKKRISDNNIIEDKIGTVGAVALDKNGNIAAATSTGGMTNKMPGRVGDTPIIGSGTWAQNNVCGVSSTGHGEFFIKYQVAKEVCTRIEYLNETLEKASSDIIEELLKIDARGGIIAIDKDANTSMPFNTDGMIRGSLTNKSELFVAIY
jgi:beta-aspartyl-peptidase (threonine type)